MIAVIDRNPLNRLFLFVQTVVRQYHRAKEGKLLVDCKKQPNEGGEHEFRIILPGSLQNPFCLTPAHLDSYLTQPQFLHPLDGIDETFRVLEKGVINILRDTGHGGVLLELEKDKRNRIVVTCSVTISYRHVVTLPRTQKS
jgi:hypothetical protein